MSNRGLVVEIIANFDDESVNSDTNTCGFEKCQPFFNNNIKKTDETNVKRLFM